MKKTITMLLALCLALLCVSAMAVTAYSVGDLYAYPADPNQRLSFRTGPGTNYTELFTIAREDPREFNLLQQEKGGSVMWGMVEFDCYLGRYRAYTGMKRIDSRYDVPYGNKEGVSCRVGWRDAYAYYGPGRYYVAMDKQVPAGTRITVYHEEAGYVMADFIMPGAKQQQYEKDKKQITRAWIPVDYLEGYDAWTTRQY